MVDGRWSMVDGCSVIDGFARIPSIRPVRTAHARQFSTLNAKPTARPHPIYLNSKQLMTHDSNRQDELKKMTLCESCTGIQRNWRKAPGHPELVQGNPRHETRRTGLITITSYRCDRCGTAWKYENDKANLKAGWSVVGR
jgi:hypothetical protein